MWEVLSGVERCDTCQYVEGLFDSHWAGVSLRNSYLSFMDSIMCPSFRD